VKPGEQPPAVDDLVHAYGCASVRAARARDEWAKRGEPFTLQYPNGMEGVHPMLKVVVEAEKHAAMLGRDLRRLLPAPEESVDDLIDEILGG
jgi:hypothetical protein